MGADRRNFAEFDEKLQVPNIKVERTHRVGNKQKRCQVCKFQGQTKGSFRNPETKRYQY